MSLYYVMRPDNVEDPDTVFVRHGRLSQNLATTLTRAAKVKGKVYEITGASKLLVRSFWVEPKAKPRLNYRAYRAARLEAALFSHP